MIEQLASHSQINITGLSAIDLHQHKDTSIVRIGSKADIGKRIRNSPLYAAKQTFA
jgi:hypothetical protein